MPQQKPPSRVLWLIAARSGSRSIPHKNIRPLDGHPLLAYRARAALQIARPQDVWISTDSPRYAKIARAYGATVPFLRPARLAADSARSVDVVLHAMAHAERAGLRYDAVGLLEPTSPFIYPRDLRAAARRLLTQPKADAIVAVRVARPGSFFLQPLERTLGKLAARVARHGVPRRQEERVEVTPSGGFYIARWERFKRTGSFYTPGTLPYLVPEECGLEIDEALDWRWAEFLLARGIVSRRAFGL